MEPQIWYCQTDRSFIIHDDIKFLCATGRYDVYAGICEKCGRKNLNAILAQKPNELFGLGEVKI